MENKGKSKSSRSFFLRMILYTLVITMSVFLFRYPHSIVLTWESLKGMRVMGSEFVLQYFTTSCGSNRNPRNVVFRQLRRFSAAQESYREKHLRYGSIPELVSADLLDKTWLLPQYQRNKYSLFVYTEYEFELVAIAMPNDYGWERNYFVDQSGVTRWAVGEVPNRQSHPIDQK